MNQITKIIKEREEEFDKKFKLSINQGGENLITYFDGEFVQTNPEVVLENIKSHNKATILAVLETLEGEVGGMCKVNNLTEEEMQDGVKYDEYGYDATYNQALSDILSLITLTKQEINK
jgi:hypothetical protein